jgi:hypothetical protein
MTNRPLTGRDVIIRSIAGIEYRGVVRQIQAFEGGEMFELGSITNPDYQRFVLVVDHVQIKLIDADD